MIPYLSRHTVLPELRIAHKSTGKSRLYRLDGNVHRAEVWNLFRMGRQSEPGPGPLSRRK